MEALPPGTLVVKPPANGEAVVPSSEQTSLTWATLDQTVFVFSREETEKVFVLSRDLEACTRGFTECQSERDTPLEPTPSRWGWLAGAVAGAFAVGVLAGVAAEK